ncbi:MAG: type II toxin-antitoxin system HicA family toxin [Candidatus Aminicenantes bacterium]
MKGSHHIYYHNELKRRVIVPLHKRDLPTGTFYQIIKEDGIDKKELKK